MVQFFAQKIYINGANYLISFLVGPHVPQIDFSVVERVIILTNRNRVYKY